MTRFSKTVLLMGAATLALAACAGTKGPGAIGTKDDIVVRNNGMPGAAKAPPPGADVAESNVDTENAELAMPPAAVEQGEPLPDQSPAVEAAAQQVENANAPMPSSAATPTADADPITSTQPATTPTTSQEIIPAEPVTETPAAAPPPVDAPAPAVTDAQAPQPASASPQPKQPSIYPAEDYPAGTSPYIPPKGKTGDVANDLNAQQLQAIQGTPPAPAATATAAPTVETTVNKNTYKPLPAGSAYPLDPNAPYSPAAVSKAQETLVAPVAEPPAPAPEPVKPAPAAEAPATPAPATSASGAAAAPTKVPSLIDPVIVRSAQTALKEKGGYAGPINGQVDAAFLNALTAYQQKNGLPLGGVNATTFRHLGVIE